MSHSNWVSKTFYLLAYFQAVLPLTEMLSVLCWMRNAESGLTWQRPSVGLKCQLSSYSLMSCTSVISDGNCDLVLSGHWEKKAEDGPSVDYKNTQPSFSTRKSFSLYPAGGGGCLMEYFLAQLARLIHTQKHFECSVKSALECLLSVLFSTWRRKQIRPPKCCAFFTVWNDE